MTFGRQPIAQPSRGLRRRCSQPSYNPSGALRIRVLASGFDLASQTAQFERAEIAGTSGKAMRFPCQRCEVAGARESLDRPDLGIDLLAERAEKLAHAIRGQMSRERLQVRAIQRGIVRASVDAGPR